MVSNASPEVNPPPQIVLAAAPHPVRAVTVFSTRIAQVTRAFAVDLAPGPNALVVKQLPTCLDPSSVRVRIVSDGIDGAADRTSKDSPSDEGEKEFEDAKDVSVLDVACAASGGDDEADEEAVANEEDGHTLLALERRLAALESTKALHAHAADTLVRFGQALDPSAGLLAAANLPVGSHGLRNGDPDGVAQLDAYLDRLTLRGGESVAAGEKLDQEIAEIEEELKRERRKVQRHKRKPWPKARVDALLVAKRARTVEIILIYSTSISFSTLIALDAHMHT